MRARAVEKLFDVGPPYGWVPEDGEEVFFFAGINRHGAVFTSERVASSFQKIHYSGQTTRHYVLTCGLICGINSLRPAIVRCV